MNSETSSSSTFSPVNKLNRINSLDVIRGIALLGILLMNINGMGLPFSYSDPTIAGGSDGLNLLVWKINNLFFEGTMRGLFTLLFGAGSILLISRLEKNGAGISAADIYYRRMLWLLIFGLINIYIFLWMGDILYPYAIFGLMLFPFRNAKVKYLFLVAGILIVLGTLWDVSDYRSKLKLQNEVKELQVKKDGGTELTKEQDEKLKEWEKFKTKHTKEEIDKEIEKMQNGYFAALKEKIKTNQYMQTWVTYRFWPWDILSFMIIGMAFFKLRIFHGERTSRFYFLMAIIGYTFGITINIFETRALINSNFDALEIMKTDQTYQFGRIGVTMGHVGLFMLFIRSGILSFLHRALAAVGTMALSNYLTHSIVTSIIFYGDGLSLFGQLQRYQLYYIVFGIWIFQLIMSPIWLKHFVYGPAEWLWRSLTYQKLQPFKLKNIKNTVQFENV